MTCCISGPADAAFTLNSLRRIAWNLLDEMVLTPFFVVAFRHAAAHSRPSALDLREF
jgi:hypothetical protein